MKINKFLKLFVMSGLMVVPQVNSMFNGVGGCIKNILFGDCISNSEEFISKKKLTPYLIKSDFAKDYVRTHFNEKKFEGDEEIAKVRENITALEKLKEAFHCAKVVSEIKEKSLIRQKFKNIIENLHNTENIKKNTNIAIDCTRKAGK